VGSVATPIFKQGSLRHIEYARSVEGANVELNEGWNDFEVKRGGKTSEVTE
jgi:hypothetical protein